MIEDDVKAVLHATRHPLLTLDAETVVLSANHAFYSMLKTPPAETEGRRFEDLGDGQWSSPDLRRLISGALEEQKEFRDFRIRQDFPGTGLRTLLVDAVPMKAAEGGRKLLLGFEDITDREAAAEQREADKSYAEDVVESIHEGVLILTPDLIVEAVNTPFCDTFDVQRKETVGRKIFDLGNGQWDVPLLRQVLEDILPAEKEVIDWEVDHVFEHIGRRVFTLSARRLVHQANILVIVRDITKLRRGAENEETLRRELQHRFRNFYSNVQAIAHQTASNSESLPNFIETFDSRIAGLSRSNDLIARDAADGVSLHDLVRTELDARGAHEGADYTLDGRDVRLGGDAAQTFGLALHELTTNAVKYGALRHGLGATLEISSHEVDSDEGSQILLRWRESGVPIPDPPKRVGYGTRLITKALPRSIGGSSNITYHSDGVEVVMRFPNTVALPGAK